MRTTSVTILRDIRAWVGHIDKAGTVARESDTLTAAFAAHNLPEPEGNDQNCQQRSGTRRLT